MKHWFEVHGGTILAFVGGCLFAGGVYAGTDYYGICMGILLLVVGYRHDILREYTVSRNALGSITEDMVRRSYVSPDAKEKDNE